MGDPAYESPQFMRSAQADRPPRTINLNSPVAGMLWFGGWLFTIGFADLGFWKGVLGLIVWPFFLGDLAR